MNQQIFNNINNTQPINNIPPPANTFNSNDNFFMCAYLSYDYDDDGNKTGSHIEYDYYDDDCATCGGCKHGNPRGVVVSSCHGYTTVCYAWAHVCYRSTAK